MLTRTDIALNVNCHEQTFGRTLNDTSSDEQCGGDQLCFYQTVVRCQMVVLRRIKCYLRYSSSKLCPLAVTKKRN